MKSVAVDFRIKLGVQCDEVSKRGGPAEKAMNLAKRMLQKQIQDNRKNSHGKTINSTSKNNSQPKKSNLLERTVCKRKKGKFGPEYFVHFASREDKRKFNNFIDRMSGSEDVKVPTELLPVSKNPKPAVL